jgi:chaperonin GroEL
MVSKQLIFDEQARQKILTGVTTLARAVKVTLGPKGRNVVIDRKFSSPIVTKDGVTVAKEIHLPDPFENIGAQLVKEVASKTNDSAGDGTTTATVLAEAIYKEGLRHVTAGANPIYLKRGIDKAVAAAVLKLKDISKVVSTNEEIRQVATVSANWDEEIGSMIADAMDKVGKNGTVTVEEGRSNETTLDVVEGMQFDKGFLSPFFANQDSQDVSFDEPYILVYEKKISSILELVPILQLVKDKSKGIVIIAEDVEGEALAALVVNKVKGALNVCAVKAPGYGERKKEILADISALTGATVLGDEHVSPLEKATLSHLGRARMVTVTRDSTTIIEGHGSAEQIGKRVLLLKKKIEESDSDFDKEKLQERLAKLSGGVAVINVGASTEAEMKEKKQRVEDALHATRAAVEEGIVPGGGVALLRTAKSIDSEIKKLVGDEKLGGQIVRKTIEAPLKQLCFNAGVEGAVVIQKVISGKKGYNVATGKYEDLIKSGVVDPTKVTRTALQNASSISGLLLTTEAIITDVVTKEEPKQIAKLEDTI